jgi:hypothetical protein
LVQVPSYFQHQLFGIFSFYFQFVCKEYFPAEHLFEQCCNEFYLLHKDSVSHENQICDKESIAEDSICHEDQEMFNYINYDNSDIETSDIISYVSIVLNNHEHQHISFEYFDVKEQGYTSAEDISYCDQGIVEQHYDNHGDNTESVAYTKGSPQFSDLQTHEDCSRYEEEDDELKSPYQQFIMHSSLTVIKQSAFIIEICEGKEKQHFFQ